MARGFVSGVVWGLVVSGLGGATVSLVAGDDSRVVLAPVGHGAGVAKEAEPQRPVVDVTIAIEPEVEARQTDTLDPVVVTENAEPEVAETPAPEMPVTDAAAKEPASGATTEQAMQDGQDGTVGKGGKPSVTEKPQTSVAEVETQATSEELAKAVEPPAPVEAANAETSVEDVARMTETVDSEIVAPSKSQTVPPEVPEAVEPVTTDAMEPAESDVAMDVEPAIPETSSVEEPASDPAMVKITEPEPGFAPQEVPVPETREAPVVEVPGPKTEVPNSKISALPQITTPAPSVEPETQPQPVTPAPEAVPDAGAGNSVAGTNTRHLPTIGGPTEPEPEVNDPDAAEQIAQRALDAYAMPFDNPEAKPMLSVVLIDDPDAPVADDALAHLPFPLSFAIDATRDDAGDVAARYRAAGFEVLLLTNLPKRASVSDVEVAFEAYSNAVPQAVAVLDRGVTMSMAQQIAGILAVGGFGLVTPSKGLNSAQKAAQRIGVPAALIFRELDADGESVSVMRRYLDRAAFRAAQKGSVIMLGSTRPETIEALVLWALEDRAASVAIAPVSAVLKGG